MEKGKNVPNTNNQVIFVPNLVMTVPVRDLERSTMLVMRKLTNFPNGHAVKLNYQRVFYQQNYDV